MDTEPKALPFRAAALVQFTVGARRMILPDTSVDLAWIDGRIDVIGPMTIGRPTRYEVGAHVTLLTIDPAVATDWLNLPLSELSDRAIELRTIDARLAATLTERFARGTVRDLVELARGACVHRISRVQVATALLGRGVRVGAVAEAVELGERQFTRWFHHAVSMNPKRFLRVVRLRRAIEAAKRGTPLAGAALDCGYADQAHFSREVKALLGARPEPSFQMSETFKTSLRRSADTVSTPYGEASPR